MVLLHYREKWKIGNQTPWARRTTRQQVFCPVLIIKEKQFVHVFEFGRPEHILMLRINEKSKPLGPTSLEYRSSGRRTGPIQGQFEPSLHKGCIRMWLVRPDGVAHICAHQGHVRRSSAIRCGSENSATHTRTSHIYGCGVCGRGRGGGGYFVDFHSSTHS